MQTASSTRQLSVLAGNARGCLGATFCDRELAPRLAMVGPTGAGRIQAVVATLLVNDYNSEPSEYGHNAIGNGPIAADRALGSRQEST
jgi:hypothetical protein